MQLVWPYLAHFTMNDLSALVYHDRERQTTDQIA
jgi:hypothetical protein